MKLALVIISNSGKEKYYIFRNRKKAFNFLVKRLHYISGKYNLQGSWLLAKYRNERVYSHSQFIVKIVKTRFFKLHE